MQSSFEEWVLNCNNKINKRIISVFTRLNIQGEKEFTIKKDRMCSLKTTFI